MWKFLGLLLICAGVKEAQTPLRSAEAAERNLLSHSSISVSGKLRLSGGDIDSIKTSGSLSCDGMTVKKINASGSTRLSHCNASKIDTSGSLICDDVTAKIIDASRSIKLSHCNASKIDTSGSLICDDVTAKIIDASGSIKLSRCNADKIDTSGSFTCDDVTATKTINASGSVKLTHCKASKIFASGTVTLRACNSPAIYAGGKFKCSDTVSDKMTLHGAVTLNSSNVGALVLAPSSNPSLLKDCTIGTILVEQGYKKEDGKHIAEEPVLELMNTMLEGDITFHTDKQGKIYVDTDSHIGGRLIGSPEPYVPKFWFFPWVFWKTIPSTEKSTAGGEE